MKLNQKQVYQVQRTIDEIRASAQAWADEQAPQINIGLSIASKLEDQLYRILILQNRKQIREQAKNSK